jgi:hypothetical protein
MILPDKRWDERDPPAASWKSLTDAWRQLRLILAPIPTTEYRDIDFTGPATSLSFAVQGVKRPRGVQLVSLYRIDNSATSAVTFSWSYANGMVTTTSFSALAATQWRATFLVIGAA